MQALLERLAKLEMKTDDLEKRNIDLVKRTDDLVKEKNDLKKQNDDLKKRSDDHELELIRVASENQWLKATTVNLTEQVAMLSRGASDVTPHEVSASTGKPDTYTQFTSFACTSDIITLSCPNNRTIFATSAYYGMHNIPCDDCCPPNARDDCTVLMEEGRPLDWLGIKELCDNQTSCQLDNFGSVIDECLAGYTSDYAQVFYDCLPVDEAGPVGFTAWANTGYGTAYGIDEVVVFDQVISNFGGHYNPDTSSFVCPFDGVYMVNVNVQTYSGDHAQVYVKRNAAALVEAWADDQSGRLVTWS